MPKNWAPDELVEEARRRTGLERFDAESFREALEVYLADYNTNERSDQANAANAELIVKALGDRLKIADYLRQRPELEARPVERPVFVFGIPRTGTTLLSNLLAADPARRSPLTWEIEHPVPPPTAATLYSDPRCLAELEKERALLAAYPEAGKYYRNSAVYPNECMFWTIHDMKGMLWEGRGKLPVYRDWLYGAGPDQMIPHYEYHKRFLQVHEAEAPGVWNLKMPSHGLWLDSLLAVYPDARLVWAHRDPLTATGSFCSLMELSMNSSLGYADHAWLGENYSWQAVQHAERIMDHRARLGHDRIIDVHYAGLLRDPIPAMRQLYAQLGDAFTAEAEAGMRTWIADNPQGKFGKHEYKLAKFGLTPEGVRPRFERYLAEYDIEPEG
ncbi:MAG TPA: sulfotransferase [Novosphingobium sp.]